MKIYIIQDGEGVSGVAEWEGSMAADKAYEARLLMTKEVNAAVEGALSGGAKEIYIQQSHRFVLEELHDEINLLIGAPDIMDDSFSATFFVGQHAMSQTETGVLAHTFCHTGVRYLKLNGSLIGEFGWRAALSGYYGVPTTLITGDKAAVEEAKKLIPEIECAAVKEGYGLKSAVCLSPAKSRDLIREKSEAAVRRTAEIAPYKVEGPFEVETEYYNQLVAERAMCYPGIERLDATTIRFCTNNFLDLFKFRKFSALIHGVGL
ncbi:MAG: M55 family metallopeptidase, partial [Planctomycetota bacterium]|jgi:D-amino peptidase